MIQGVCPRLIIIFSPLSFEKKKKISLIFIFLKVPNIVRMVVFFVKKLANGSLHLLVVY